VTQPEDFQPSSNPETSALVVNGSQGPNDLAVPGSYGRNTAFALHSLETAGASEFLVSAFIRFTPEGSNATDMIHNALGFSWESIQRFATNEDSRLTFQDLVRAFDMNIEVANAFFKVLDIDETGEISVLENAALLLFQDNPKEALKITIDAYTDADLAPTLLAELNAEARQALSEFTESLHTPCKRDGQLSPQERSLADWCVLSFPTLTKEAIRGIRDGLDLASYYETVKPLLQP
jgi:hypothetical protein